MEILCRLLLDFLLNPVIVIPQLNKSAARTSEIQNKPTQHFLIDVVRACLLPAHRCVN